MSRNKAPLALMEQLAMLLIFALAAAVCLQVFVTSDRLSRRMADRDRAAQLSQNVAEVLRHTGGDFARTAALLDAPNWDGDSLMIDYDGDWALADGATRYTLGATRVPSGLSNLGKAQVWCRDEHGDEELFRLEVAWQEVTDHGE